MSKETNYLDWDSPPVRCPYCGDEKLCVIGEWKTTSVEDPENEADLEEWQCHGKCQGRSFWV